MGTLYLRPHGSITNSEWSGCVKSDTTLDAFLYVANKYSSSSCTCWRPIIFPAILTIHCNLFLLLTPKLPYQAVILNCKILSTWLLYTISKTDWLTSKLFSFLMRNNLPPTTHKVPTTPFRNQVVNLQVLPLEEADPALALLCSVHALQLYMERRQSFRTSEQLFVCYEGQQKAQAVSKQRMAHWIVDAIALAYQAQGVPCPLRLRAHSTRNIASSWVLARGTSLTHGGRAAGWATPNTFAKFNSLHVEPVSSCVLTSNR